MTEQPFREGALIKVEKRRSLYKVAASDAVEGGGYMLTLMPLEPPYLATTEAVYRDKGGTWRTEQLEVVEMADMAKPKARATAACHSCHAPIYWDRGKDGKPHPYNPDGVSHFATCPDAEKWRTKTAPPATQAIAPKRETWDEPDPSGQLALFEMSYEGGER